MADPPFEAGAVKATETEVVLAAVAVPMVGAPGVVTAVTELEAAEAALLPTPLVAVTLKVYAVPVVRPVTVQLVPVVEQVRSAGSRRGHDVAGDGRAVGGWCRPADGGRHRCRWMAVTPVGAPGTLGATMELEAVEAGPVPTPLVAVTVKV